MASTSAAARLCILACRSAPRVNHIPRTQRAVRQCVSAQRAFTTTRTRWAREVEPREEEDAEEEETGPVVLKKLDQAFVDGASVEEIKQLEQIAHESGFRSLEDYLQSELDSDHVQNSEDRVLFESILKIDKGAKANRQSFWFDEEDPEMNTEEHDEFDEDDITSMAHGKLDEVREMRHYARLAVWEMPLLAKLAKPFTPPTDTEVLRWRYTSYMGEFHPAEKKVVVQFSPYDLKLEPVQIEKLKKLAGPRYNPETQIIKMSSESFEHQAQNKAYLSGLVDELIAAAKDPKDTFADIPLDTRHHQKQKKPKWPKEWNMTEERRLEIQNLRNKAYLKDKERVETGKMIEGAKVIDSYLLERAAKEQEKLKEAELVAAALPARGSGGARARR